MTEGLIEIAELTKTYGMGEIAVHALRGVDLRIARGEFVAVMGPSGSGKSTLMNILGCLDRPTAGSYVLDGEDVSRLSKNALAGVRNRKIGFVFQSYNLLPRLTALKNVLLPLLYNRNGHRNGDHRNGGHQTNAEPYERAAAMLESVGLGERMHHRPNELSGGQQQRVAIARALVNRPAILLADEPTGNLDSQSGGEIMELLHELHEGGVTIVMVTHDPEAAVHAGRMIQLRDGLVEFDQENGKEAGR
jgi:putative ABC transport system ATP-binding protein